jgi:isopenicillin N synthase-like dioxygenase
MSTASPAAPVTAAIDAPNEIPIIDFSGFKNGTKAERQAIADKIGEACRRIGFFYVTGHGVPATLQQHLMEEAKLFFNQPLEKKMKFAPRRGQTCGYLPSRGASEGRQQGESLVKLGPDGKPIKAEERKIPGGTLEQFTVMRELPSDDPDVVAQKPLHLPNIWPDLPGFRETTVAYQKASMDLAQDILRALALGLGIDEEYFTERHRKPLSNFAFNYYPAPEKLEDLGVGVGAHCDVSVITVLLQDDVGGLEVCDREGRWIKAAYVPGAYVVNIGETMMQWTNGEYVSTLHRVIAKKLQDRYSVPLFMGPDYDLTIEPLPVCITPERPRKFEPFHNGKYMSEQFAAHYGRIFEQRKDIFERFGLL